MTRDELITMAREAGYPHAKLQWNDQEQAFLERFAALVAAAEREAEREACARTCEARRQHVKSENGLHAYLSHSPASVAAGRCADAIRARGAA